MSSRGRQPASQQASSRNTPLISFRLTGWPEEAKREVLTSANRSEYLRKAVEFYTTLGPVLAEISAKLTEIERSIQTLEARASGIEELLTRAQLGPPRETERSEDEAVRRQRDFLARWAMDDDDEDN